MGGYSLLIKLTSRSDFEALEDLLASLREGVTNNFALKREIILVVGVSTLEDDSSSGIRTYRDLGELCTRYLGFSNFSIYPLASFEFMGMNFVPRFSKIVLIGNWEELSDCVMYFKRYRSAADVIRLDLDGRIPLDILR